jgi:hypothetical protein
MGQENKGMIGKKNGKHVLKSKTRKVRTLMGLLGNLVEIQERINNLPPLSVVEKAKFEQEIAIEQLYNSSKLEGNHLTEKMIEKAINGPRVSPSQN